MRAFIILALAAVVSADVSHLKYQNQNSEKDAEIVQSSVDVGPESYNYQVQTSNGIQSQESGQLKNAGREDEAIVAQGSYAYTAPDGSQIGVSYTADENGYNPKGAHLPTPPPPQPIPDYILRSIEYNLQHAEKPQYPQKKGF